MFSGFVVGENTACAQTAVVIDTVVCTVSKFILNARPLPPVSRLFVSQPMNHARDMFMLSRPLR